MGLNETPSAERVHIGFFGRRNAGKSSVVNAITGQEMSVVSEIKGTTTDPVTKAMELLPMGPVVIIDTPGFDDEGALGEKRVRRTKQILNRADCAVLIVDAAVGKTAADDALLALFRQKQLPYVIAYNKCDLVPPCAAEADAISVSAHTGAGIHELKERIARLVSTDAPQQRLVGDLICPQDVVVLVVPIDASAPKGRLILPQQQAIRDILESGAISVVAQDSDLAAALGRLAAPPALVITDETVPLTSFSILMARYKGFLEPAVRGAATIDLLQDGDRILISEGCTHHRQCEDIGTVKLPNWLRQRTGKDLRIETSSGREFPEDLSPYRLIIHCGGCMLNEREMRFRQSCAADAGVPFTNYGTAIAHLHGVLKRSLSVFPALADLLSE